MVTASSLVDRRLFAALQSPSAAVAEMAFERIYRRHGPVLLAFVAHCTANLSLAQQVAEEVFVQLWNEPESFHPSRTWAPDGTDDPALLIGAWRHLRFDERAAIGLLHFGEMTPDEGAEVLGVTKEAVHSLVSQGLRRLARVRRGAGEPE